jgi:hypothetical protein
MLSITELQTLQARAKVLENLLAKDIEDEQDSKDREDALEALRNSIGIISKALGKPRGN